LFLRGTVPSDAEIERAEKIATAFSGQVVNLLRVDAVDPAATLEELQKVLEPQGLTVQMIGEVVVLQGTVDSEATQISVEKIARASFPQVINDLEIRSQQLSDEEIEARLQSLIDSPQVQVHVDQGRVALKGVVEHASEAENLVQGAQLYSSEVLNLIRVQEPASLDQAEQITQALEAFGISAQQVGEVLILQGEVKNEQAKKAIEKVAKALGEKVANLVRVIDPSQVQVEVQILEINRRALRNLGVDWNETFDIGEAVLGGAFKRLSPVEGILQSLIEEGQAKVLSNPTLTVLSGEDAKILVGGRIPIPVTSFLTGTPQGGGGGRQNGGGGFFGGIGQSIDWQDYGIKLEVTPVVEGNLIRMKVKPEVSDIDHVNAVRIEDSVIPAFTTRESETTVQIPSGESIVIGGLIKHDVTETVRKFPFLGDIPILGQLFRSKRFERKETELVITVTPTVLAKELE